MVPTTTLTIDNHAAKESTNRNNKLIPTTLPFLLINSKYGGNKPTASKTDAVIPKIKSGHFVPF